jgi:type IV secretion system protein VirB11
MSRDEVFRMLALVANAMNTEITAAKPSLAALVPGWQARLQAMVPPVVAAPVFTIRKPPRHVFTLDNYVERAIVSPRQADLIRQAVRKRDNILIGGSTGSGKTTLANAVLHEISVATKDRLYIVEDMRELQSVALNKLQLFVQEPLYTWQRAIMDALRSRPDRIIVGELRTGAATLELVKAWNTGHPGGIATLHANDTAACLDRVCQLIEEAVPAAPRPFIAQAINVVVHLTKDPRHPAGRRLTGVDRVRGLHPDGAWHLDPVT